MQLSRTCKFSPCLLLLATSEVVVIAQDASGAHLRRGDRELQKNSRNKKQTGPTTSATNGKQKPTKPPTPRNTKLGLIEKQSCVPFSSSDVQAAISHPWTDATCATNQCGGGCCRAYDYLKCDRYNNHPTLPCVCNEITAPIQGGSSTGTINTSNTTSTTENGSNSDFGEMPPYEGINPADQNAMAAICQNGSQYWAIDTVGQSQRCTSDASCTDSSMCCDIDTCFCVPSTSVVSCVPPFI